MKLFTSGFKKIILTIVGFSTTGATIFVATQSGQYENFIPKKIISENDEQKQSEEAVKKEDVNTIIANESSRKEQILDLDLIYGNKGDTPSGLHKIGVLGVDIDDSLYSAEMKKTIDSYTINDQTKDVGSLYTSIPEDLVLYNSQINSQVIPFDESLISSSADVFVNTFFNLINVNLAPTKEKPISLSGLLLGRFKAAILKNKLEFFKLGKDLQHFDHKNVWTLINEYFTQNPLGKKELTKTYFVKSLTPGFFDSVHLFDSVDQSQIHQTLIGYQGQQNSYTRLNNSKNKVRYDHFANFNKNHDQYNTFFINNKDGVHNANSFYNKIKKQTDKQFVLIGDQAKYLHQTNTEMATENITTGSYSEISSAYMAGFQSTILAIKKSKKGYHHTKLSFLIGAINDDGIEYKKALAFKKGVEAAAGHYKFNEHLSISFTSEDIITYSVSELKNANVLGVIADKENFKKNDQRIIYIAGTTSKDWKGKSQKPNFWISGDDPGLIGSLYKYKNFNPTIFDRLSISLVLDEQNNEEIPIRHNLNTIGVLGKKRAGTKYFTAAVLKALYLSGYDDILSQHNDFGAPLKILSKNPFHKPISGYDILNPQTSEGQDFIDIIWESFFKNF